MAPNRRLALRWEMAGIAFIVAMGALLHFAFEWSGYWTPVALFAGINESTWEHFKIGFWPAMLFALIEYPFLRRAVNNFWPAKTLNLLAAPAVIAVLFYAYTAILGRHELSIDVVIFIIAVAVGQMVSYRVMTRKPFDKLLSVLLGVVLALLVAAYSLLSFFPPRWFLFEHPESGEYGILDEYGDHEHDDQGHDEEEHDE